MPGDPNKLSKFWQELKRRRVNHVIVVYATAAFVIIELINNVTEPLHLPDWTPTLVIIILLVGFPLAIIFSWIFDVTPEGIEKTKPSREVPKDERSVTPNSWRIATYVSVVIIIGLIIFNIFGNKRGARIDESQAKSIAVLPFHNLSGDNEQEYICDGLTEEIIGHLFKVRSFEKIVSFSSVMNYKNPQRNIPKIAEELGVNYILEGSYKRMGDKLKITAQLIEPRSDNHIWGQDHELQYSEVPGIPGEIALQIAKNLKAFISEDVKQSIDRIPTDNIEAYECLQQAMNYGGSLTWDQRMELAKKAIELDPNYADAYAWIGSEILFQANFTGKFDIQSVIWEAERYIDKAIEIDPYSIVANWGMCAINLLVKWDYVKVIEAELNFGSYFRSDDFFILGLALFCLEMGMFEEVLSLIGENQPYGIMAHIMLGNTSYARELLNKRDLIDEPSYEWSELYIWLQDFDSALYYLESATESENLGMLFPRFQADLAVAYHKTGHTEKARNIVSRIIQRSDTTASQSPAYFTGWYYSWIGEPDSAFYWLEKAVENRSIEIPWLKVDPAFNSLKDDPRYLDLYERTGHKAFDDYMASKEK